MKVNKLSISFIATTVVVVVLIVLILFLNGFFSDHTCVHSRQSPVNIVDYNRSIIRSSDLLNIEYLGKKISSSKSNVIHNNIHFTPSEKQYITFNNVQYELIQYHFHSPSEHFINSKKTLMEVHLVHKDKDGDYVVIGFFIEKGMAGVFDDGISKKDNSVFTLNRSDLNTFYYTYAGSLTTAPFSANVRWIIFPKPLSSGTTQSWGTQLGAPVRSVQRTLDSEILKIEM